MCKTTTPSDPSNSVFYKYLIIVYWKDRPKWKQILDVFWERMESQRTAEDEVNIFPFWFVCFCCLYSQVIFNHYKLLNWLKVSTHRTWKIALKLRELCWTTDHESLVRYSCCKRCNCYCLEVDNKFYRYIEINVLQLCVINWLNLIKSLVI